MIIEIYKDSKLYECEIWQEDIGIWRICNKSNNIEDIKFNIKQTNYGFTDRVELYLE